jgi:hypothetical protein
MDKLAARTGASAARDAASAARADHTGQPAAPSTPDVAQPTSTADIG